MDRYDICTNYIEIIAGTNNTITKAYQEAANEVNSNSNKSLQYLKNFLTSMESINSKCKDSRISSSKGNIKSFSSYDSICTVIEFLNKNLSGISIVKDLNAIKKSLEDNQSLYTDGYSKNNRLVVLEYESALYMLVTGLSMTVATKVDVSQSGTQIKVVKKSANTTGITDKTVTKLAKEISTTKHKQYLEDILKAQEAPSIKTEGVGEAISATVSLIDNIVNTARSGMKMVKHGIGTVKSTLFGLIPLLRSCIYQKYKKKADTVRALEDQAKFLQQNIEQLQNRTNMDPEKKAEIIAKQQAVVEAYKKKAEKLRAELVEGEKDAAAAIQDDNKEISNTDDGDLVLEGMDINTIFTETGSQSSD